MGIHNITTPRGTVTVSGGLTAKLEWNPGFGPRMSGDLNRIQAFVDSEVLRKSEPYVPLRTGMLIKSGQLGTEIGSGEVKYVAPYAAAQYYRGNGSGRMRGAQWFERMKNAHAKEILEAAERLKKGG